MEELVRNNAYYGKHLSHPIAAWRETAQGNQEALLKIGNGLPEAAFVANVLATPSRVVRGTLKFEDMGSGEESDGYLGPTKFQVAGRVEADDAHTLSVDLALPVNAPIHNRDGAVSYKLQAADDPSVWTSGYFATLATRNGNDVPHSIPLYENKDEHIKAKLPISSFDTYLGGVRLGAMFEPVQDNGFATASLSSEEKVKVEDLYKEKSQQFAKWLVDQKIATHSEGGTFKRTEIGRDAIVSSADRVYADLVNPDESGEKGLLDVSGNFAAMLFSCALTDALNDYKSDNEGVVPTIFELLREASEKKGDEQSQKTFSRIHEELVSRYSSQDAEVIGLIGAALCGMDGLPAMRATNLMSETCGSDPLKMAADSAAASFRTQLNGAMNGIASEKVKYGSEDDEIGEFNSKSAEEEEEEEEGKDWTGAYALLEPVLSAIMSTPKEDIGHPWKGVAKVDYTGLGWGIAVTTFAALEYILLDVPYGGKWTLERGISSRLASLGMISTPNSILFSGEEGVADAGEVTSAFEHSYHGVYLSTSEIGKCLHEFAKKVTVGGALEKLYRWAGPAYISRKGTLPVLQTGAQSLTLVAASFMKYVSIIGIGMDDAVLIGHGDATGVVVFVRGIKDHSQLDILKAWFEHTSGQRFSDLPDGALPIHYQRAATVPAVLATATDERYKGILKSQTIDNMAGVELLDVCNRKTKAVLGTSNDAGIHVVKVDGAPRYLVLFDYAANKYVYADLHDGGYIIHPGRVKATKDTFQIDGDVFSPAAAVFDQLEELKGELMEHENKYRLERRNMSAEDRLLMQSESEYKYQKLPVTSERVGNILGAIAKAGVFGLGAGVGVGLGLGAYDYYSRPYYVDYGSSGYMNEYGLAAPIAGYDLGNLVLSRSCYYHYGGNYMYLRPRCYGTPFPLIIPVSLFGLGNWSYGYNQWYAPYYSWFGSYRRRYPNWYSRLNQKHNRFWNNRSARNPRWTRPANLRAPGGRISAPGSSFRPVAPRRTVPRRVRVSPMNTRSTPFSWKASRRNSSSFGGGSGRGGGGGMRFSFGGRSGRGGGGRR